MQQGIPRVFGIAGRSGSGKTTLIEAMLPLLAARGLKVSVIKHSHHDLELEPPHKDSARFRRAGAHEVMVASPYRYAIVHEEPGSGFVAVAVPRETVLHSVLPALPLDEPEVIVHFICEYLGV